MIFDLTVLEYEILIACVSLAESEKELMKEVFGKKISETTLEVIKDKLERGALVQISENCKKKPGRRDTEKLLLG